MHNTSEYTAERTVFKAGDRVTHTTAPADALLGRLTTDVLVLRRQKPVRDSVGEAAGVRPAARNSAVRVTPLEAWTNQSAANMFEMTDVLTLCGIVPDDEGVDADCGEDDGKGQSAEDHGVRERVMERWGY
jgi:hypothetical protein